MDGRRRVLSGVVFVLVVIGVVGAQLLLVVGVLGLFLSFDVGAHRLWYRGRLEAGGRLAVVRVGMHRGGGLAEERRASETK